MRGASVASLEAVREGFEPMLRKAGTSASTVGAQLFAVTGDLVDNPGLRRALSDPSRSAEDKAGLARTVFGAADPRVLEVVAGLAAGRWSSDVDLVDAVEELAAHAVLASAEATGDLPTVEDELFRFDRMLIGQRDLRRALVDRVATRPARAELARRLLAGKVHPATEQLVVQAAYRPRGRRMSQMLARMGKLAARRREMLVATVTAAAPLDEAQTARLHAMLERSYGRKVSMSVAVEPSLIGGLKVQVGSQVVDATVLARLDGVRRQLAG